MASSPFIDFIVKREQLRLNKEAGKPPPWTTDPILATYRFTNIRRRDDRVSRWLIKNVVPLQDHPEFLEFLALCRWVNWPPTLHELIYRGLIEKKYINWSRVTDVIESRMLTGEKTWTGAYMIRADNRQGIKRAKADYIVNDVCRAALMGIKRSLLQVCLKEPKRSMVWELVRGQLYWGSFMAGQFVDDLTWTKYLPRPRDDYTWAPMGPGSKRGFNRVVSPGESLNLVISEYDWLDRLQRWRMEAVKALGKGYGNLTAMDIQNCLCEYDKYMRVKNGEGRPRSTYKPHTYQV